MNAAQKDYLDFLFACQTIGGVCGSNGRYQAMLYRRIEKKWHKMTIQNLLDAIDQVRAEFNTIAEYERIHAKEIKSQEVNNG